MYDGEKASSFLRAIDKYAKKQRSMIVEEMREIEERELQKAETGIMEDVSNLIQRELVSMKNKITIEVSHKELEEKRKLALKRQKIMKEIFSEAKNRLIEFTRTHRYPKKLESYASSISRVLRGENVVLYVYEGDLKYSEAIKRAFGRECTVEADDEVKIGGIRGYDRENDLIADETIDEALNSQIDWFAENYGVTLI